MLGRGLAAAHGNGNAAASSEEEGSDYRAAQALVRQLGAAIADSRSDSGAKVRTLTSELQRLVSFVASSPTTEGSTKLRLEPIDGGAARPVILTATWSAEQFSQHGDFSATFAIPGSVPLGEYTLSVAVSNGDVGHLRFFNVSTFVSPEVPVSTTLTIRAPLAYKKERFVVERPPVGKRTPTCKGDYGSGPGSPKRAFDSLPAFEAAFAKAAAK